MAEGGGSAKILTTSNGGEDWRETLQPSSGSLMSVQCMEDGEAWAGGGVLGGGDGPPLAKRIAGEREECRVA